MKNTASAALKETINLQISYTQSDFLSNFLWLTLAQFWSNMTSSFQFDQGGMEHKWMRKAWVIL